MWRDLPDAARSIAVATSDAVAAAQHANWARYDAAVIALGALNREHVSLVLGNVVRALLEELHPDGFDGDDLREVARRCGQHQPGADQDALLVLLAGALGVHLSATDAPPVDVARQAPLLIADLLTATGRPLAGYLRQVFAEIARAETIESP